MSQFQKHKGDQASIDPSKQSALGGASAIECGLIDRSGRNNLGISAIESQIEEERSCCCWAGNGSNSSIADDSYFRVGPAFMARDTRGQAGGLDDCGWVLTQNFVWRRAFFQCQFSRSMYFGNKFEQIHVHRRPYETAPRFIKRRRRGSKAFTRDHSNLYAPWDRQTNVNHAINVSGSVDSFFAFPSPAIVRFIFLLNKVLAYQHTRTNSARHGARDKLFDRHRRIKQEL